MSRDHGFAKDNTPTADYSNQLLQQYNTRPENRPYGNGGMQTQQDMLFPGSPGDAGLGRFGPQVSRAAQIRHLAGLVVDVGVAILFVVAAVGLALHFSAKTVAARNLTNTGNVVITTGTPGLDIQSEQNAPLTLAGTATPLTITVTNTGTTALTPTATITASSTALAQDLTTSGNFCIGQTCSSAGPVSFTGVLAPGIVLQPGQTGLYAIFVTAAPQAATLTSAPVVVSVTITG